MTHAELVERAKRWLWGQQCGVVITELVTGCRETPDAIGWNARGSILVECKTSSSDFYTDKRKPFRAMPEQGMGNLRYFMAPKGVLRAESIPEGWGLIEPCGERVRYVVRAVKVWPACCAAETRILVSAMRRMIVPAVDGVSCNVYQHTGRSLCTASVGVAREGFDPDEAEARLREAWQEEEKP